MDYWNLVWLVLMLGGGVVAPAIWLVVAVRGLGADRLSEKQRQAGGEELRKAGVVRDGESWEARDLDELLLNMRQYDQYKAVGAALTILVTGGIGMVALIRATDGWVNSFAYLVPALGIWAASVALGMSVGYVMSDMSFAAPAGALPMPQAEAIFSGAGAVARRRWWLRVLDIGLVVGVITCALIYALGKGGRLEDTATRLAVAHHPWLIWCVPVALGVIVATQELRVWWEMRRPSLGLTEQPELAGRADLHRRREVCRTVYESEMVPVPAFVQLMAFSSSALSSIGFALSIVAFGAYVVEEFASTMVDTRRKRQARRASDVGLRGGGGAV